MVSFIVGLLIGLVVGGVAVFYYLKRTPASGQPVAPKVNAFLKKIWNQK